MVRAAAVAAFLILGACGQSDKPSDICPNVAGEMADARGANGRIDYGQQHTNYEICLSNWAYRLSPQTSDIDSAVAAVLSACEDAINMRAVAIRQINNPDTPPADLEEPDYEAARRTASRRAIFYVVAGRSGECKIKPLQIN